MSDFIAWVQRAYGIELANTCRSLRERDDSMTDDELLGRAKSVVQSAQCGDVQIARSRFESDQIEL